MARTSCPVLLQKYRVECTGAFDRSHLVAQHPTMASDEHATKCCLQTPPFAAHFMARYVPELFVSKLFHAVLQEQLDVKRNDNG